jgi:hypothetical protein
MGHGGDDVFSFNHKKILGPSIHVFDDVEWGSDAASSGGGSFAEIVRCPFETFWWGGSNGGVSFEEPSGESCNRLIVHKFS